VTLVGLAVKLKAVAIVYVTVVDRLSPPLVPPTVTVNAPDVALVVQESVEVPEDGVGVSAMLVGLRPQVRPVNGVIVATRLTVPVNPFNPVTVTIDVPGVPEKISTPAGFALNAKSSTVYVTLVV